MQALLMPFVLILLFLTREPKSAREDYYFPIQDLLSEKTYCFINKKDTSEKCFWKLKAILSDADTILQTTIWNNNRLIEEMQEQIQNGSSKVISYRIYRAEKFTDCTVIDSSVYKHNQNKGETIQWKIIFQDFDSPAIMMLT